MAFKEYVSANNTHRLSVGIGNESTVLFTELSTDDTITIGNVSEEERESIESSVTPGFSNGWLMMKLLRALEKALPK